MSLASPLTLIRFPMQERLKKRLNTAESNRMFINYLKHADTLVDVPYPLKSKSKGKDGKNGKDGKDGKDGKGKTDGKPAGKAGK